LFERNLKERIVDIISGFAILFAVGFGSLLFVRSGLTFIVLADYTVAILLSISILLRYFWGGGSQKMQYFYGKLLPVVTIMVLFAMVYYRDTDESDAYWIYLIPPVAIFVLGRRLGIVFTTIFLIWVVVANYIPDNSGHRTYEFMVWMKAFWIYVALTALCLIYERIRSRNHKHIYHILQKLSHAKEELETVVFLDPLTEVRNRRGFELSFESMWKHAIYEKKPMSLLAIDVDDFRNFNNTHGHPAGDLALKTVAHLTEKHLHGAFGRLGGDEFGAVFYNIDQQQAVVFAELIRKVVEKHHIKLPNGTKARITISIGVSTITPEADTQMSGLVLAADANLYKAKELGKNRVVGD
jgi:diguanylate cyclase (GGDEF)-like protein